MSLTRFSPSLARVHFGSSRAFRELSPDSSELSPYTHDIEAVQNTPALTNRLKSVYKQKWFWVHFLCIFGLLCVIGGWTFVWLRPQVDCNLPENHEADQCENTEASVEGPFYDGTPWKVGDQSSLLSPLWMTGLPELGLGGI